MDEKQTLEKHWLDNLKTIIEVLLILLYKLSTSVRKLRSGEVLPIIGEFRPHLISITLLLRKNTPVGPCYICERNGPIYPGSFF